MTGQLEIEKITKSFGETEVLNDVTFDICEGDRVAIIGQSGCGKSTLLRLLAGLEIPTRGEIRLDSQVISMGGRIVVPPYDRGIAMVFQDLGLWPNMSVIENVLLGLSAVKESATQIRQRGYGALELCGIESLAARRPGQISGGQQQRVALARALALNPRFLFLDEPFAGLDLVTKINLLEEISSLASSQNMAIVLVTHDPMEATTLCKQAVVLNDGSIMESGALGTLLQKPQSEILTVFSKAAMQVSALRSVPGSENVQ